MRYSLKAFISLPNINIFIFFICYVEGIKVSDLLRIYTKGKYEVTHPDLHPENYFAAYDKRSLSQAPKKEDVYIVSGDFEPRQPELKRKFPFKPGIPGLSTDNRIPEGRDSAVPYTYPPQIRVTIDGSASNNKHAYDVITVALQPEMTVFQTLVMAAITYHRLHRFQANPFNVVINWDDRRQCEKITSAMGIENTGNQKWKIIVQRRRRKRLYKGVCIPPSGIRLRPNTRVYIRYE